MRRSPPSAPVFPPGTRHHRTTTATLLTTSQHGPDSIRFMAGEQVRKEQGAFHEPLDSRTGFQLVSGASSPSSFRGQDARGDRLEACPTTFRRFMVPMRADHGVEAAHEPYSQLVEIDHSYFFRFMGAQRAKNSRASLSGRGGEETCRPQLRLQTRIVPVFAMNRSTDLS